MILLIHLSDIVSIQDYRLLYKYSYFRSSLKYI